MYAAILFSMPLLVLKIYAGVCKCQCTVYVYISTKMAKAATKTGINCFVKIKITIFILLFEKYQQIFFIGCRK